MLTVEELYEILETQDPRLTSYRIDIDLKDYPIEIASVGYYIAEGNQTVKVEGLENYLTQFQPKTVHCFIAKAGAPSFPEHTDLTDVTIYCIDGIKTMEVEGVEREIAKGDSIFIPVGTFHRATNKYDSIMLSVG
jgi:hypothetical protein